MRFSTMKTILRIIMTSSIGIVAHARRSVCRCLFRLVFSLIQNQQFFESRSNRDHHLRSSIHRSSKFSCPGRKCKRTFISESALILHCESGTCRSGVTRHKINRAVTSLDSNNIITNPNRLLRDSEEQENYKYSATSRSWNGAAYECYLCHKGYGTLRALNQHLGSPAHRQKIYHCFGRACGKQFTALA